MGEALVQYQTPAWIDSHLSYGCLEFSRESVRASHASWERFPHELAYKT